MRVTDLPAPRELIEVWGRDLDELTSVQEAAVAAGILDADWNLLVVAPTSSGKTLVGEMAAARIAMTGQKHVYVTVPMRALAEEHYQRLQERYSGLMSIVISTGDRLEFDDDIRQGRFDLAVLTYEKLAALLIQSPAALSRCGCVVIDEGQMIGDKQRGAALEVMITQVMMARPSPRLVVLSASLDELHQLERWLGAKAVVRSDRPVPLDQAVCAATSGRASLREPGVADREVQIAGGTYGVDELAVQLALSHASAGRQVIVFRNTIKNVALTARAMASRRSSVGVDPVLNERLLALEDGDTVRELADLVASGVAVHNADMGTEERQLVEAAFRDGHVRILVATATLAMGVNTPADVVIVADAERPVRRASSWLGEAITVAEYRNAAGRAGRLSIRSKGLAVLLAPDEVKRRQLFQHYIAGDVEPVESQIPRAPLHDAVFRLLASGVATTQEGLVDFVSHTFAYVTFYDRNGGLDSVRRAVQESVFAALEAGLFVESDGELVPTPTARTLAGTGVSLPTAIVLNGLVDGILKRDLREADIIYTISLTPESGDRPYARNAVRWDFTPVPRATGGPLDRALRLEMPSERVRQALEQTACLLRWMEGAASRDLHRDFGMTRERLRAMGGEAAWLLQSLARATAAAGVPAEHMTFVRNMALQAQHGLPAELASLASVRPRGVSREALMALREAGIISVDDILEADEKKLQPALSPAQVERLKDAILTDTASSLRRKRTGHLRAAAEAGVPVELIDTLYSASGKPLEVAVEDAFRTAGLSAKRIPNQPAAEEDVQVATEAGTVIVSVTGSQEDSKPVKWTKAKEVMGQGAGLNPVNCVCIGRPRFEGLAEQAAREIAREAGDRRILLMTVDVLAEAVMRCARGEMTTVQLSDVLASRRGMLTLEDLPLPASQAGRSGGRAQPSTVAGP